MGENKDIITKCIVSANVGDSRAVLSRDGVAIDLTQDHKPNNRSELERVKKLGGSVKWFGFVDPKGYPLEGTGVYRINGNLAVARAIGDRSERPFVSSEVELSRFYLKEEKGDQFIILASDGLWDVMTSQECVSMVHEILTSHVGALREGGYGDIVSSDSQDNSGNTRLGRNHVSSYSLAHINDRTVDRTVSDWTEIIQDDRGVIIAANKQRKEKMARYLAEEALRRGSSDNVTVVVVWLKNK